MISISTEELMQAQADLDHASIQQTIEASSSSSSSANDGFASFFSSLLHSNTATYHTTSDNTTLSMLLKEQPHMSVEEQVQALHQLPLLLPYESLRQSFVRISVMVVCITLFYTFLYVTLRHLLSPSTTTTKKQPSQYEIFHTLQLLQKKSTSSLSKKLSYQLLHLTMNLLLTISGLIAYLHLRQIRPLSLTQIISGLHQYKLFGEIQIAYQLFSLPAGVCLVKEPWSMLAHHVAVVVVSSTAAFLECGYRYYAPYFFATIEISSVFLSVVNTLKCHPELPTLYPTLNQISKLLFAACFLVFRVVLWLPEIASFFPAGWEMMKVCNTKKCVGVYGVILGSAGFLTVLQLYWGYRIVVILSGMFFGGKEKKKEDIKKGE